MPVDQTLRDFVVRLATDVDFMKSYAGATEAERRQMMLEARLVPVAIAAIEEGNAATVENRIRNTQVALKKASGRRAAAKRASSKKTSKKTSARKAAKKK